MSSKEILPVPLIGSVKATGGGAQLFSPTGRRIGVVPEGESATDLRGTRVWVVGGVAITSEPGPDGRVFARLPGSETGSLVKIQ